ncbi:MAG: acetyl/propionyl/methylcrotonyl-CoA carboxylase subunit alpha [Gemmatimonadota bacterium]
MFDRVLVANRGEIAVRVIRACREMGVSSVAVYSEADRRAPHVLLADRAVPIGPAPAAESYLDMDRILAAADRTRASAIHPGYGFLAESAEFARRVEAAGLSFIGPPAEAILAMGDKTAARRRMREAGVPVIPGSEDVVERLDVALREAEHIGYPVLLKAAAGGGGKGMRIARGPSDLTAAFARAEGEARKAFGDGRLYLERYLEAPRHIEIQILADSHGTVVHLGERECSIQRRHQKLIEEAPSSALDSEGRARMGAIAVQAARAAGYVGVGTVEFLVQDGECFFLEMNTRLQVEHPVTELVTGVDLVQEQLRVARGERTGVVPQPDWPRGHAIECRVGAEDPWNAFLPSQGRIGLLRVPGGPGVRWDSGIVEGLDVGLHYDSLLAKLVVHADDRESAIARMRRALAELRISGPSTTVPFHLAVMEEPDFRKGHLSVRYVDEHPDLLSHASPEWLEAGMVAAVLLEEGRRNALRGSSNSAGGVDEVRAGRERSQWQRSYESARWGPWR